MASEEQAEPARVFNELARVLYQQADYDHVYRALTRMAVEVLPGCDHASLSTMREGESMRTLSASDDVARLMDELENEAGEGPCIDAMLDGGFQLDADIVHQSSWPKLAALAVERSPVRGMIGYRVFVDGRSAGALDVFSDTAGALTQEGADLGAMVAAFASVALASAAHDHEARTLREGLESNREIGKAIGLLMVTHHVDDEEAFELLRGLSSTMNVKLAEVAHRLVVQQREEQAAGRGDADPAG